jgi:diguanylate cyclase (GGDEF)-like protein
VNRRTRSGGDHGDRPYSQTSPHPTAATPQADGNATIAPNIEASLSESHKALALLARLVVDFTSVLSPPDLLGRVTRALREEVGFDSCVVSLLANEDGEDVLVVRAASGHREVMKGKVLRGRGLSWAVMDSATPLLVNDLTSEPRWFLKDERCRSAIFTPLTVQRGPIGVLSAYRETVDGFTNADLHLLTAVARYLASAVEVARLYEQLMTLAATDPLTRLANRRAFLERVESEIARSRRAGSQFCVVLLDLNHFKTVNDVGGHAMGDQVLRDMADGMVRVIRQSDVAGRFGGDEFTLLLPESTSEEALEVLNRLRHVITSLMTQTGRSMEMSFSWGIAVCPDDGTEVGQLLQVADRRLYMMKGTPLKDGNP